MEMSPVSQPNNKRFLTPYIVGVMCRSNIFKGMGLHTFYKLRYANLVELGYVKGLCCDT